jgi:hypothetical protein
LGTRTETQAHRLFNLPFFLLGAIGVAIVLGVLKALGVPLG